MTDYELADCLSNLMHKEKMIDEMSNEEIEKLLDDHVPENLSVDKFMSEIIGVPSENFDEILQTWEAIRNANAN